MKNKNRNKTTVHKIAQFLRHEITYSNLKSGKHLKESEIAKKFNVSRVPVREAFRMLETEGYLEVIPNKGCFVKGISPENIHEIAIVYKALAPIVLKESIPRFNEKNYQKVESILTKIEKCKDFSEIGYLLWDFAKEIYKPSKLTYVMSIFDDLYIHNIRILNEIFEISQNKRYDTTSHRKLLELCRMKKTDEAIRHWCNYVDKVRDMILKSKIA